MPHKPRLAKESGWEISPEEGVSNFKVLCHTIRVSFGFASPPFVAYNYASFISTERTSPKLRQVPGSKICGCGSATAQNYIMVLFDSLFILLLQTWHWKSENDVPRYGNTHFQIDHYENKLKHEGRGMLPWKNRWHSPLSVDNQHCALWNQSFVSINRRVYIIPIQLHFKILAHVHKLGSSMGNWQLELVHERSMAV